MWGLFRPVRRFVLVSLPLLFSEMGCKVASQSPCVYSGLRGSPWPTAHKLPALSQKVSGNFATRALISVLKISSSLAVDANASVAQAKHFCDIFETLKTLFARKAPSLDVLLDRSRDRFQLPSMCLGAKRFHRLDRVRQGGRAGPPFPLSPAPAEECQRTS